MLESLAATLLNRLLGSYIENFDPNQLNVGIWSGDVKLKNLKLRKDCLDGLDIPLDVKYGILGDLVLNVPWSSLKNKPVKIIIEDCYLLCVPRDIYSLDLDEKIQRDLRLKLRKLMEWEMTNKARRNQDLSTGKDDDKSNSESFTQSLITKVVDNLQVSIKNIHIRYEDINNVFSKSSSSVGVSLSELSAVSTDKEWKPSFIEITQAITHKLLTLDALSVYWNTDSETISKSDTIDPNQFIETFRNFKQVYSDENQYLMKPVTGTGQLSVSKLGTTEAQPHIDLQLLCDKFGLELDDSEYADFLHVLSQFQLTRATQKFKKNRPTFTVSENPKGWFKYIGFCVRDEIHEKHEMWTWNNIKKSGDQRRRYIELWIEKLKSGKLEEDSLTPEKEAELLDLHKDLGFDTIVLFRTIANRQYIQSKIYSKEATPGTSNTAVEVQQEQKPGTWISSWWNGSDVNAEESNLVMTEEQEKELYDAIDFNDKLQNNLADTHLAKHLTKLRITGLLTQGSLVIKNKEQNLLLGSMLFKNCNLEFLNRPDSSKTSFKLQEFKVEDGSPNTLFKDIICSKDNQSQIESDKEKDPLFQVSYESNPLDGLADSKVVLKLLGTTVFYHVHFITEIMRFFKPKSHQMDTIGAIINAASATMEGWTSQTRMGIESLLEEHKTVDVNLDLQAPLIIIPLNPHTWDTPCAVIDAGHISIISDLVPKDKIKEIRDMSPTEYDKIDGSDINRLMFDRFRINSQDTQILIGPNVSLTLDSVNNSSISNKLSILERMELDIIMDVSILPKALKLPRFRLFGHLPKLSLSFNDLQYKIFLELARNIIPSIDDYDLADGYPNAKITGAAPDQYKLDQRRIRDTLTQLTEMTQLELDQKFLEVHFDVDNAQFSLYQCTDVKTMQSVKLIDLVVNTFKFNFTTMAKQMNVDISVYSLLVEDHIVNSDLKEFQTLISSDIGNKDGDLITLGYSRIQRIVNHEDLLIEVFDQDININMTKMKIVLTPKSILSLLNYMVLTFTDPNAQEIPADALKHNEEDNEDSPQKLKMTIKYDGLDVVLNDDSLKIATMELAAGEYNILFLPESMKLNMKFDGMELTDEINDGADRNSTLRKLISMNNQELIELSYEKFDATTNTNNYDSFLKLVTGSMFVNFNRDSIRRLLSFFHKFQKMRIYFDRVRQVAYNQAPSLDTVNNLKVDISVKAPVIQFSRISRYNNINEFDLIKFYLGEIFIENEFTDINNDDKINHIKLGLRNGQISSIFNLKDATLQKLFLADGMCISFDIDHNPLGNDANPVFMVAGKLEALSLGLTELQLSYLLDIINTLEATFILPDQDSNSRKSESPLSLTDESVSTDTMDQNIVEDNDNMKGSGSPPLSETSNSSSGAYSSINFNFEVPQISLTLFDNTELSTDIKDKSLTKITLQDMASSIQVHSDGSSSGNAHIAAFTVEDTRNIKDNKHTELIKRTNSEVHQFSAIVTRKLLENGLLTNISTTVHSPRIILAMDHIFALKRLMDVVLSSKDSVKQIDSKNNVANTTISSESTDEDHETTKNVWQYSLNIIDTAVILLADPSELDSEAVVFGVEQFLFTEQNITTISANNIGMFLSRINALEENKVRLLDDFSSSLTIDRRNTTIERFLTDIHASIEPLVMRISLRDIRLAMMIFNRAISLMNLNKIGETDENHVGNDKPTRGILSKEFERKITKYAPSLASYSSSISQTSSNNQIVNLPDVIIRGETFDADFGGFRLILLGDVHEMPILDTKIEHFSINAKDWSTNLDGIANLLATVNIFNYSRSSWEPLIDSVPITFHLAKGFNQEAGFIFDIVTRKVTEITLSSRSLAMLTSIPKYLSSEVHLVPRGSKKPYRLTNNSGLDLNIWIADTKDKESKRNLVTLKAGASEPWEFEGWKSIRERLDTDSNKSILGVCVADQKYNTIMTIDATYEGELLHVLHPPIDHVHNRIICELICHDDNVKEITFRSTLLFENTTGIPLQFKVVKESSGSEPILFTIEPSESSSVPVEYAYASKIFVKPLTTEDFGWSKQPIVWKQLLDKPLSIDCKSNEGLRNDKFFFEVNGKFDRREPLARIYPHMKVTISPSLVIENLLPCDIQFSIFGKQEEIQKYKLLKKSEKTTVYDVSLNEFLLLAVQPLMEESPVSKSSIINTPKNTSLEPETILNVNFANGQQLQLYMKYQSIEGSRSKVIKIYSPYIIINSTDRDLYMQGSYGNMTQSKVITDNEERYCSPKMFSFETNNDKNNRARIKFRGTDWSIPLSLDAIGQSFDTTVAILDKSLECNLGIGITEGSGKFSLSKIVTISPRYIIKNELGFPISLCETGSVEIIEIGSNGSIPLYNLRNIINKQLILKTLGVNTEWTAPFFIKDIGLTYLKLLRENGTHMLLKLEITLDQATIFVRIMDGQNLWPFSIRNFSDSEFIFYQRDPTVVDEYYEVEPEEESYENKYKPLYYRVPPKSVMPYAWDYPIARQKKIILTARGRKREIQLAEIGNLKPMRVPSRVANEDTIIVDLNVIADGPTQALVISRYDPSSSLYKLRNGTKPNISNTSQNRSVGNVNGSAMSGNSSGDMFEINDEDKHTLRKINISIEGFGLSLITKNLKELAYLNIKGIDLSFKESDLYQTFSWKIKWLQVDNQSFGSVYQSVLYPTQIPKTAKDLETHPIFSGSVSKVKDDSFGIQYFKHATFLLQEFSIQLDEDFVYSLIDYMKFPGSPLYNEAGDIPFKDKITVPKVEELKFSNDIYFEVFHIQPTVLHLSFVSTEQVDTKSKDYKKDDEAISESTSVFLLHVLTMTVGNVNGAPIKLNALFLDNVRVPLPLLLQSIQTHYSQQFFYQIHMILGSADFLGNPVGLFNTISSGVWDLFYEPYQGYMLNDRPQELGIYFAKGGLSFAKKTVFGLSDSMAKVSGSVAKGLSVTQDEEFQNTRKLQQRINNNSRNVFSNSAQSFASTLGSGIAGIALDPIKGSQKEGASGFFKGLGKGLIGLPTKTAIGFLDLTSNISQGVKSSTTILQSQNSQRIRLPRYINHDQILRPFDLKEAQGQYWLKSANGGLFMNDQYLAHVVLPGKELSVVVSMQRIAEIRMATQEVMWGVTYNSIQGINLEREGIRIKLKTQSEYFIPIADPQEKRFIYKNISIAVIEYNKYCEAAL